MSLLIHEIKLEGKHLFHLQVVCFSVWSSSAADKRMVLGHFSGIFGALKVRVPFVPSAEHSTNSTAPQHTNCP